jgi:hypothetical protein
VAKATCSVEGCDKPSLCRTWCAMHYGRWSRHGDPLVTTLRPTKKPCTVKQCDRLSLARGWCTLHYERWKKHGDPLHVTQPAQRGTCSIDGCDKPAAGRGWCAMHWRRWKKHGNPAKTLRRVPGPCLVEKCDRPGSAGHGWCEMHYRRWQRHGSPLIERLDPRKTCRAGHPLDVRNTRLAPGKPNRRACRTCAVLASHRRRSLKANAPVRDLTAQQWREIKAAYGHRCAYCHRRRPLTMDHVIPLSKGGPHTASNVVPACLSCNSGKNNREAPTHQPLLF